MYARFEELLKLTNTTAYKVALSTGVSKSTLSDWKHGRSTPKYEALSKIADYFGVTVEYLYGTEEKKELAKSNEDFMAMLREHNKGKAQVFFCGGEGKVIELSPEETEILKRLIELRKNDK